MDKSYWFCNEWECPYRKNLKYIEPILCDNVWNDECPYADEFYKSLKEINNDKDS